MYLQNWQMLLIWNLKLDLLRKANIQITHKYTFYIYLFLYRLSTLSSVKRKEVKPMDFFSTFVISVVASVVAYYISKWLDGDK